MDIAEERDKIYYNKLYKMMKDLEGDCEAIHSEADNILLDLLTELGYVKTVRKFNKMCERTPFWYA